MAFAALAGCSAKADEPIPAVAVHVAAARRVDLQHTITSEAIVYPRARAVLVPKISAPVRELLAERGDHVRRGQVLARLEDRDLRAAATESEGVLDEARARYRSTKAGVVPEAVRKAELEVDAAAQALATQQRLYDERKALFDHGAVSRRDLDETALALVNARTRFQEARQHRDTLRAVGREQTVKGVEGQVEEARGKHEAAAARLGYAAIRSPIDGVVVDRPLYPGEMASAGKPLITVMDLSSVIVRAHLAERDAFLVKVGDPVTITAPAPQDSVRGTVTVVGPALDPGSTTVEVRAEAPNRGEVLRPGMTARVTVVVGTERNALVVPESALVTSAAGTTRVVIAGADGKAHDRRVDVGLREGGLVEILRGLNPGDRVVTVGAFGLTDGTKLRVEPSS